jgi:hypothetical protein
MEVNCGWYGKRMNDKHIDSLLPDGGTASLPRDFQPQRK